MMRNTSFLEYCSRAIIGVGHGEAAPIASAGSRLVRHGGAGFSAPDSIAVDNGSV